MKDVFVHYGCEFYDTNNFLSIRNRYYSKPFGGFWLSPVTSVWGWKDFCASNTFKLESLEKKCYFKFFEDSNIHNINTVTDLYVLPWFYDNERAYVDFIRTYREKNIDALWLTLKGFDKTQESKPVSTHGWDCESILVLNKECIYQI